MVRIHLKKNIMLRVNGCLSLNKVVFILAFTGYCGFQTYLPFKKVPLSAGRLFDLWIWFSIECEVTFEYGCLSLNTWFSYRHLLDTAGSRHIFLLRWWPLLAGYSISEFDSVTNRINFTFNEGGLYWRVIHFWIWFSYE